MTLIFLILIFLFVGTISDNSCGDWEAYEDEKCLKIFENAGLLSYADAENFCKEQDDSHLLTIGQEEEQKFIESFLTSKTVVDYVWIGLKYLNNTYQWIDKTEFYYTNWANGSPKNDTNHCVQIQTDDEEFGKWSEVLCSKKNLVICERIQLWSLTQLQTTLMNLIKNPIVPIGFIYVQLPKEKSPEETWPWMEWEDISLDYAGMFFRTVGGNASDFGEVQEADSPRLTSMRTLETGRDYNPSNISADGQFSNALNIHGGMDHTTHNLEAMVSAAEVRPRNMAMKIWRRIK